MSRQSSPSSTSQRLGREPSLSMKDGIMKESVRTEAPNNPGQISPSLVIGNESIETRAKMLKDIHDAWRKEPNESKLQHILDDAMARSSEISMEYEVVPAVTKGNVEKL